jgi:hypothetical protein
MIYRRLSLGSISNTAVGAYIGQNTCAKSRNRSVKLDEIDPSGADARLSHSIPSMLCCAAKKIGVAANGSSRGSFALLSETTPTTPVTPAVTKLAVAEKHIYF